MQKKVLFGIAVITSLIITAILTFILSSKFNLTPLERIKINEISDEMSYYYDVFDSLNSSSDNDIEKYIIFSLKYSKNKNNINSLSSSEIKTIIDSKFSKNFSLEEIESCAISPSMIENNVFQDYENRKLVIEEESNNPIDISSKTIIMYDINSIKKINKNSFVVTYNKLIVEKPHDIYNYYSEKGNSDTLDMLNYLKGEGNVNSIKKYIKSNSISNYGKTDGTISVKFIINNNDLLIEKIYSNNKKR